MLREESVDDRGVFTVRDRPTTRKTRIVAHNQQVVRADWEDAAPLQAIDRAHIVAHVRERAGFCDAVILSDYAKGLLGRRSSKRRARVRSSWLTPSRRISISLPESPASRRTSTKRKPAAASR